MFNRCIASSRPFVQRRGKTALVSIHDAMPDNLSSVIGIIRLLQSFGVNPITLFVVPGIGWTDDQISELKCLENQGLALAGHGWVHRIGQFKSWRHRLHGLLFSRNEAEHMSLNMEEITSLIRRSHSWFEQRGLHSPSLYVPPAWAMGSISRSRLRALPYRFYETLTGVFDALTDRMVPMPLCGYMADSGLRTMALRLSNGLNQCLCLSFLRIAIHPDDLNLPLADDLERCLKSCSQFIGYGDLTAF